jgi:hypothetical protein
MRRGKGGGARGETLGDWWVLEAWGATWIKATWRCLNIFAQICQKAVDTSAGRRAGLLDTCLSIWVNC